MTAFNRFPRRLLLALLIVFVAAGAGLALFAAAPHLPAVAAQLSDEQRAIDLATSHEPIASALAHAPAWTPAAHLEDEAENIWHVEFYTVENEDWIGEAYVDLDTDEILEFYVPAFLPPDEIARISAEVEAFVLADAEVLALLGDPNTWGVWTDYDPWEAYWYVGFYRGLESWAVEVGYEEGEIYILRIFDPDAFDEEEAMRIRRYEAVELAYEADGLWEALEGIDDWTTYVSPIEGWRWAVSFVSGESELFYALVDIDAWAIIETGGEVPDEIKQFLPFVRTGTGSK